VVGVLLGSLMGLSVNAMIFGGNLFSFDILYRLLGGLIGGLISGEDTPSFRFSAIINQWRSFVLPGLLIGFLVGLLVCQSIPYAFLMMLLAATCFIKTVEVEATALLTAMSLTILWVRNGHNSRRHFTYCNLLLS